MSIAADPRETATAATYDSACHHCGAPLERDQEWCLECGTARTVLHRPPDWRVPIAIIGIVVVLVGAGFAIALIALSNDANKTAAEQAAATATKTVTTAAATAPAPPIRTWPVGLPGWTVVLATAPTRAAAVARAKSLAPGYGQVGVLDSSLHPALPKAQWLVFYKSYPTQAMAQAAAAALGQQASQVVLVARPGQP
jgi:RNA polymerase subunit RPABC4/transcription elongation factor Spt4